MKTQTEERVATYFENGLTMAEAVKRLVPIFEKHLLQREAALPTTG